MTLAAGAKLGPYQIVAALGAGGMGHVYRARDTRLGREVARALLSDLSRAGKDVPRGNAHARGIQSPTEEGP